MKARDLWLEFTVEVMRDDIGLKIPLCGLCTNIGIVDTTTTAVWAGKPAGIQTYCICPNGRARKKTDKSKQRL